jgi:hypothetical protein
VSALLAEIAAYTSDFEELDRLQRHFPTVRLLEV